MSEKKESCIPIQLVPMPRYEEEEMDLKNTIKTLLKHKKFIISFTFAITLISIIYIFIKTPIYEIKADLQIGYLNNNGEKKQYILDPTYVYLYIKNKYPIRKNLPIIKVEKNRNVKSILTIKIENYSNDKAIQKLNNILKQIHFLEKKKINVIKTFTKAQINLLEKFNQNIQKSIKTLYKRLSSTKNSQLLATYLTQIQNYQQLILKNSQQILTLKKQISPQNIIKTSIIGPILTHDYPIKPKRKLIIIIVFITSFIFSIFLVFFIEFIKSLKEEIK